MRTRTRRLRNTGRALVHESLLPHLAAAQGVGTTAVPTGILRRHSAEPDIFVGVVLTGAERPVARAAGGAAIIWQSRVGLSSRDGVPSSDTPGRPHPRVLRSRLVPVTRDGDCDDAERPLFLEDLSVGQKFRTASTTVELDRIKAFAAEFDPQFFHLDEAAAGSSIFGGLVASGWHTAALTMRLMVEGELRVAGGLVGLGVDGMRWPQPVRPGDRIRVETEVVEVRPSRSNPSRGIVKFKSQTLNQNDEVVMEQVATLVVPRARG